MTCLEHLIENCLCKFGDDKPYEEIKRAIENDINLADSGITADQCYEICQYVWFTFIRYGGYEKINDGDIIIHKNTKERTDEEIKWLVEYNAEVRESTVKVIYGHLLNKGHDSRIFKQDFENCINNCFGIELR